MILFSHHVDFVMINSIYHFEIDPSATLFVQQRRIFKQLFLISVEYPRFAYLLM